MAMTADQKKAFCRMKPRRFKKGGMVVGKGDRKYFDGGGTVNALDSSTALGGPGTAGVQIAADNPNAGIAGTITGALGLNNNMVAQAANLQPGTNAAQLNQAYTQAQSGLAQQQGLASTLIPGAQAGVNAQNDIQNQLLAMSRGEGPNPARAELAQATGQNIAQTASEMAGARGASANAGMLAREIAQQGAATQQQGVGQASTLEAQQQIAAQERAAGIAQNQISNAGQAATGVNTAAQNEQGQLQGANTSFNNAQTGMQSNINNVNAQVADSNQQARSNVFGGALSMVSALPAVAALFSKGGPVKHLELAEMIAHAHKYASGGAIAPSPLDAPMPAAPAANWAGNYFAPPQGSGGPNIGSMSPTSHDQEDFSGDIQDGLKKGKSKLGTSTDGEAGAWETGGGLAGGAGDAGGLAADAAMFASKGGNVAHGPHKSHVANFLMAKGGPVPAMVSPGEIYLSPEKVRRVIEAGENPIKIGHKIPGKASVKNDSRKNDTVPVTLEEGGVVIPRHISTHKMAAEKAELFVHRAAARRKASR